MDAEEFKKGLLESINKEISRNEKEMEGQDNEDREVLFSEVNGMKVIRDIVQKHPIS